MMNPTAKRGNDGDIHPHDSPKRANTNIDEEMKEEGWNYEDEGLEFTEEEIEAAKNSPSDDEMEELDNQLSIPIDNKETEVVEIGKKSKSGSTYSFRRRSKKIIDMTSDTESSKNSIVNQEPTKKQGKNEGLSNDTSENDNLSTATEKHKNNVKPHSPSRQKIPNNKEAINENHYQKVDEVINDMINTGIGNNNHRTNGKDDEYLSKSPNKGTNYKKQRSTLTKDDNQNANDPNNKVQDSLNSYFYKKNEEMDYELEVREKDGKEKENTKKKDPKESDIPLPFIVPDNVEDDHNSIDSGETTVNQNQDTENQIFPIWRFRLVLDIPPVPEEIIEMKKKGEKVPDELIHNIPRIRNMLGNCYDKIQEINDDAVLLPWSEEEFQSYIPSRKAMPKSVKKLSLYFNNFRSKEKGKLFLNIRMFINGHTGDYLSDSLTAWLENEYPGSTLSLSLVQAERSEDIGWLAYSYEYTNTRTLSNWLADQLQANVGCRLIGVVPAEKDSSNLIPWFKRTRAICISCDYDRADEIKLRLQNLVGTRNIRNIDRTRGDIRYNLIKNLVFLPMEKDLKTMVQCTQNYAKMVERHTIHIKTNRCKFFPYFLKSIDRVIPTRLGTSYSLREMIMKIPARNHGVTNRDGSAFKPVIPLFNGLDWTDDSSKQFFSDGKRGPGGRGFIFSYYSCNEKEALQMIKGLGIYLSRVYGRNVIRPFFTSSYWDQVYGWSWNIQRQEFNTPEAKQMRDIVVEDSNMFIVNMHKLAEAKKPKGPASIDARYLRNGEKALLTVQADPDQDSLPSLSAPPKVAEEIDTLKKTSSQDNHSTTSSITFNSGGSSEKSHHTNQEYPSPKPQIMGTGKGSDIRTGTTSLPMNSNSDHNYQENQQSPSDEHSAQSSSSSLSLRTSHLEKLLSDKDLTLEESRQILKKARMFQ